MLSVTSSASPTAASRLAATRDTKVSPESVISGKPVHSASLAVVWALTGKVSREQIGQALAGEMGVELEARREHQAAGGDAARLGMAAEIVRRGGIVMQQPQHAALDPAQQPHPGIEHRRPDLVAVVERAEHEAARRQAGLGAARCALGDGRCRSLT